MHNAGAEANGGSGTQVVVQGIRLGKQSLTTVQDLEVALDAAVHINRHLNRELQSLSEQLSNAEADRHAWEAHAKRLAMQLAQHKLAAAEAGACHHQQHSCSTGLVIGAQQGPSARGSCLALNMLWVFVLQGNHRLVTSSSGSTSSSS